jgi:prepilin-type N-terminal cleavage/methylation domain-containing protein
MKIKFLQLNRGYTIIETMIAVSLFLIVVTIAMNSLLGANVSLNKAKDMRSIIDNLSFIMEDMTRNIRTGTNYRCDFVIAEEAQSCSNGRTFSFNETITGDRWVYRIVSDDGGESFYIEKSTNGGSAYVRLTDSFVKMKAESGFSVLGAETQAQGDDQQPFVTIRLVGEISFKGIVSPFNLQTSVSQRSIDIDL